MGSSVAIDMVDMPFFFFSSNGQCEFRLHAGLCLDRNENKLKSELADPDDEEALKNVYVNAPFKNYVNGESENDSPHYVEIVRKLTPTKKISRRVLPAVLPESLEALSLIRLRKR